MAERRRRSGSDPDPEPADEDFNPVATMVLMLGYIVIFATLWGLVYYFDLLGRR